MKFFYISEIIADDVIRPTQNNTGGSSCTKHAFNKKFLLTRPQLTQSCVTSLNACNSIGMIMNMQSGIAPGIDLAISSPPLKKESDGCRLPNVSMMRFFSFRVSAQSRLRRYWKMREKAH